MNNMPREEAEKLSLAMQRPEGSVALELEHSALMDNTIEYIELFSEAVGSHVFVIERDAEMNLKFYYSSTAASPKVATIALKGERYCKLFRMVIVWTPTSIRLHLGLVFSQNDVIPKSTTGIPSTIEYRLGEDGIVYRIDASASEIMGLRLYSGHKLILQPPAISLWEEAKQASEYMVSFDCLGDNSKEYIAVNAAISMLVTGFEAYTKNRVIEIEKEGINPDIDAIAKAFSIESDFLLEFSEEAKQNEITILNAIIKRNHINFQNFNCCKSAFNKAYNIKFGHIGLKGSEIEIIKSLIQHRHRVIHVHPFSPFLAKRDGREEIKFINTSELQSFINLFDKFINHLHQKTIELKRID